MEGSSQILAIYTYAREIQKSLQKLKESINEAIEESVSFENVAQFKETIDDYNRLCYNCSRFDDLKNVIQMLSLSIVVPADLLYLKDFRGVPTALKSSLYSREEKNIALSIMDKAERGCATIVSVLERLIVPKISLEDADRLISLKREVEEIERDLGERAYLARNIKEAIEEYEKGHFLAAGLIASRIVCYVIDQIPGKNDEEKIKKLLEVGVIEKERKDEQETFLHASRISRNVLSHQPWLFPKPEESMELITHAIKLCRYLIKLMTLL